MPGKRIIIFPVLMVIIVVLVFLVKNPNEYLVKVKANRLDYPDKIDIKKIPDSAQDRKAFCFSDRGAWHGYGLIPDTIIRTFAGFTGPFIMTRNYGEWISPSFINISLIDPVTGKNIHPLKHESHFYPGILKADINYQNVSLTLKLWFISDRSAVILCSIHNNTDQYQKIYLKAEGTIHFTPDTLSVSNHIIKSGNKTNTTKIGIIFPKESVSRIQIKNKNQYRAEFSQITIPKGDKHEIAIVQPVCFNEKEWEKELDNSENYFSNAFNSYMVNTDRWNGYLDAVFKKIKPEFDNVQYKNLAVKSILTLTTNWRASAGDLLYDGIFPSYNYKWFHGFWSWDSWKQATAVSIFDEELAKNQLKTMFAYQNKAGMVADVIYADKEENNWRDTKPPLSGWSAWNIYSNSGDKNFLEEITPRLLKYHYWWYKNRDYNQNGLCEYGSTDGTLIAAAWESGMDNAVRFDSTKLLKNNSGAWSMNQESVDLNSYLYAEKIYLSKICQIINLKEANQLKKSINQSFYNQQKGYYFDKTIDGKFIDVAGPEGWIPLWANIATPEIAKRIVNVISDNTRFNTYCPFPTIEAKNPNFDPVNGYWRGPVWFDQAYFAIEGLKKAGFDQESLRLQMKLLQNAGGLLSDAPLRENYNPINGEGLNANHFSWTAAHILMLITEGNQ